MSESGICQEGRGLCLPRVPEPMGCLASQSPPANSRERAQKHIDRLFHLVVVQLTHRSVRQTDRQKENKYTHRSLSSSQSCCSTLLSHHFHSVHRK